MSSVYLSFERGENDSLRRRQSSHHPSHGNPYWLFPPLLYFLRLWKWTVGSGDPHSQSVLPSMWEVWEGWQRPLLHQRACHVAAERRPSWVNNTKQKEQGGMKNEMFRFQVVVGSLWRDLSHCSSRRFSGDKPEAWGESVLSKWTEPEKSTWRIPHFGGWWPEWQQQRDWILRPDNRVSRAPEFEFKQEEMEWFLLDKWHDDQEI